MGRKDKPAEQQKPSRAEVKKALKDARDTPIGNLGISTDDALEAIRRGKEGGDK
jgi:hypothetical protein